MDNIAGSKSSLTWAVHISVALLVLLWIFPTVGLLVSSFRTADQISASGWWNSMFPAEQNLVIRAKAPEAQLREGDLWVIEGNLFEQEGIEDASISRWGTSSKDISAYAAGEEGSFRSGESVTLDIIR